MGGKKTYRLCVTLQKSLSMGVEAKFYLRKLLILSK
jgi:hypothetical protein